MAAGRERDGCAGRRPRTARKMWWWLWGSNFHDLDPYDATHTLQVVQNPSTRGCSAPTAKMKLKTCWRKAIPCRTTGWSIPLSLQIRREVQDGTDFNAEAVKVNLDRASNPENGLKRYNLYKNIAQTEVLIRQRKITLKEPFSAFINILAHPATAMISPAALKKYGKEIPPVGTGPYELLTWNQTDFVKVKNCRMVWQQGAAEAGYHHPGGR